MFPSHSGLALIPRYVNSGLSTVLTRDISAERVFRGRLWRVSQSQMNLKNMDILTLSVNITLVIYLCVSTKILGQIQRLTD